MGCVYAVEESDGLVRALKVPHERMTDDVFLAEFEHEARTWLGIDSHPNILQLAAIDRIAGRLCLVMEYVGGGSLQDVLHEGHTVADRRRGNQGIELEQLLRLSLQFCDGMVHVSERHAIVHRDIKPANCLLTQFGSLKISDFGIARALRRGWAASKFGKEFKGAGPGPTTPKGTLPFMAPEARRPGELDTRADVYSFGVMCHYLLSGDLPSEPDFDAREWIDRGLSKHALPNSIRELLSACVEPDRDARPTGFRELRSHLAMEFESATQRPAPSPFEVNAHGDLEPALRSGGHLTLDEPEDALRAVNLALEREPDSATLGVTKASALQRLGKYVDALQLLRGLLGEKRDPLVVANLAATLARMGRNDEALPLFEEALSSIHDSPTLLNNSAICLLAVGRREEAFESLLAAKALAPQDPVLERNLSAFGGPPFLIGDISLVSSKLVQDLLTACESSDLQALRIALEAGASPNSRDANGTTALHEAAASGSLTCLTVLLEAGADPNVVNTSGYSPLTRAAFYGQPDAASLLIEHGADHGALTADGASILTTALLNTVDRDEFRGRGVDRFGCMRVARILIGAGADPDLSGSGMPTAAQVATRLGLDLHLGQGEHS